MVRRFDGAIKMRLGALGTQWGSKWKSVMNVWIKSMFFLKFILPYVISRYLLIEYTDYRDD